MKKCNGCQIPKPEDQFHWKVLNKYRQSRCKECVKAYSKQHYYGHKDNYRRSKIKRRKQRRQMAFNYLKTHPCVDCGEGDPILLEFDHQRDKRRDIARLVGEAYSVKTILKEIEKCEVRCANCHRRKTAIDFGWYKDLE